MVVCHADIPHLKLISKPFDVRLNDIDLQKWISDVHNNSLCKKYRIFKTDLSLENYLCNLNFSDRKLLSKLRCSNIKLPNNTKRFSARDLVLTWMIEIATCVKITYEVMDFTTCLFAKLLPLIDQNLLANTFTKTQIILLKVSMIHVRDEIKYGTYTRCLSC